MSLTDPSESRPSPKDSDPGGRMRNILSAADEDNRSADVPSPLTKLPRAKSSDKSTSPSTSEAQSSPCQEGQLRILNLSPAFWTVTGVISLIVNAVLISLLIAATRQLTATRPNRGDANTELFSSLYVNVERLDQAHIQTIVPVDTEVPIDVVLSYQKTTNVILTKDTPINAQVRINTGTINIDAPASIVLSKGTVLPVDLDLKIPFQTNIKFHLDLPVDISVAATDLHEPLLAIQNVLKPYYCSTSPDATTSSGDPLCP